MGQRAAKERELSDTGKKYVGRGKKYILNSSMNYMT